MRIYFLLKVGNFLTISTSVPASSAWNPSVLLLRKGAEPKGLKQIPGKLGRAYDLLHLLSSRHAVIWHTFSRFGKRQETSVVNSLEPDQARPCRPGLVRVQAVYKRYRHAASAEKEIKAHLWYISCRTLTDICFSKLTVCRVRIFIRQEAPVSHYLY